MLTYSTKQQGPTRSAPLDISGLHVPLSLACRFSLERRIIDLPDWVRSGFDIVSSGSNDKTPQRGSRHFQPFLSPAKRSSGVQLHYRVVLNIFLLAGKGRQGADYLVSFSHVASFVFWTTFPSFIISIMKTSGILTIYVSIILFRAVDPIADLSYSTHEGTLLPAGVTQRLSVRYAV